MKISPFDTNEAFIINEARKTFLDAWLPEFIKTNNITTSLDVGCGFGFFSRYLRYLGLKVLALDARQENVAVAKSRNPDIDFIIYDIEDTSICQLGSFDMVFCFGLLYHMENPFKAIRNLYSLTGKFLLIETQTAPYAYPNAVLYDECNKDDQSLNYTALIPSESCFIKMLYKAGFEGVYSSKIPVMHREFRASLINKKARTIFLSTRSTDLSLGVFSLRREPKIPFAGFSNWLTVTGKVFNLRGIGMGIVERLNFLFPSRWAVNLCLNMQYKTKKCPAVLPKGRYNLEESIWRPSRIIRALLWRWFSISGNDTFILRWYYDIKLVAYPSDEIGYEIFRSGKFEPNEFYFLDKILEKGMTFIDVGANMGLFALFASKKVGKEGIVIAIEPSDREFYRLKTNIELNELINIYPIKVAASNHKSVAELLVARQDHAGHNTLGNFAHNCSVLEKKQSVQTDTLDNLFNIKRLNKVDFIKMDTEGHELFALQGAVNILKRFHPILLIELSDISLVQQGCDSGQICDFLNELGYKIYCFDKLTGLITLTDKKSNFYENIVAVHKECNLGNIFIC